MQNYLMIPQELRDLSQWVVWQYENRGTSKLTKVPYCPQDGRLASVNNPAGWSSFEKANEVRPKFAGLGFILTSDDPYCFVDFDDPNELTDNGTFKYADPVAVSARQQDLHSRLKSYSEISPSGKGLHIICRASVPAGRRRNGIEVYSSGRFMTMTGDVFNAVKPSDQQPIIDELWASLEGVASNAEMSEYSVAAKFGDEDIFNTAREATNGDKFIRLWQGDTQTYHNGDHSAADFALIDILAFYTQDREQIRRLFLQSELGKRQKAKRHDYVQNMITRSFDHILPQVDISGLMKQMNDFAINSTAGPSPSQPIQSIQFPPQNIVVVQDPNPTAADEAFELPPGLMGEIAKFVYKSAWKPVKQIATIGALGLMAGMAGRAYNASGSGLNLYLLLLAKTGRGKEAISKAYEKIFDTISPLMPTIGDFAGPGDLASGQALLRYMSDHQTRSFVSVFGEFGPMLKRITSPTALGADLMTQKVMLDMYSKSGRSGKIGKTAYSEAERNTKEIHSPGFSFVAESAPKWFDENVSQGMIETGLLPRFIISEYDGPRVQSNEDGPLYYPTTDLINQICSLATCAMTCFQQNTVVNIPYDSAGLELSRRMDKETDDRVNNSTEEIVSELWNRAHLNTIRVAGLVAVGINPYNPVIDRVAWEWSERFIRFNINKVESKFLGGLLVMAGNDNELSEARKLESVVVDFLSYDFKRIESYGISELMHRMKVIPFSYMQRRLIGINPFKGAKIGPSAAIRRGVQVMIDNGDLQELPKQQATKDFNFHGRCFVIRSTRLIKQVAEAVKFG